MGKVKSLLIDTDFEDIMEHPDVTIGELIDRDPKVKANFEAGLREWELSKYSKQELETELQRRGYRVMVFNDEG